MKRKAWAKKVDDNQAEIIEALEQIGCEVEPITGCKGMNDLLVALAGRVFLLEVKNPDGKNIVDEDQEKFHARFPVTVVRSIEEALEVVTK